MASPMQRSVPVYILFLRSEVIPSRLKRLLPNEMLMLQQEVKDPWLITLGCKVQAVNLLVVLHCNVAA